MSGKSFNMNFKPGKGEIMIVGSKADIAMLANKQKDFVGEDKDVNGAIACVSLQEISKMNLRKENVISCLDHLGEVREFKTGFQCSWLWGGSRARPVSWDTEISFQMNSSLNNLYSLGVFFDNGTLIPDGNPFIGGTQDPDEDLKTTALRELNEEVGLSIVEGAQMFEIPTVQKNKKIWVVNASDVY